MRYDTIGSVLFILLAALSLTACATTAGIPGGPAAAPETPALLDALDTLAENPLVNAATRDADRTLAWVSAQEKAGMEPMKVALARACPTAVKAATADLRAKIVTLKAKLAGADQLAHDVTTGAPIYTLTVLKYGAALDPKAEVAQLRADIGLRVDALFTGCMHLFPKKQVNDVLALLAKLGITSQLGPIAGVLP